MCLKRPLSRPWGPPLGLVCAVPTAHRFRPRGFAPPRRFRLTASSGFVAPQYRTGFAAFRDPWNLQPEGLASHVPFPAAHSHPSKRSPRWQPYRITTAVAFSTFAGSARLTLVSQRTRLSHTPGPTDASQVRRPTPAVRMAIAAPSLELLDHGPSTVWTPHRHR